MIAFMAMVCMSVNAQDVRMATLQHGDEVKVFTGTPAFKNAVAAAQKGDLITLTAGNFDDVGTIDKVLTIQGAGYRNTSVRFNINLPEGEEGFYVEGVNFSYQVKVTGYAKNMTFKRCRFSDNSTSYNNHFTSLAFGTNAENIQIIQCRLYNFYGFSNNKVSILNSAISFLYCDQGNIVMANHCVIGGLGQWIVVYNSAVGSPHKNPDANPLYYSIFGASTDCRKIGCWQVGWGGNYNNSYGHYMNWGNHPFETTEIYIPNIWDMQLILKEEAREKYFGDDGTEVGLYGGELGFTETPSNPQIVEHEVPSKVDDNGLLHVRFKVEAQK